MIDRKQPHLVMEVRLVHHGYQLDIYDYTLATADGQNVIHRTECHDWSEGKSICRRAEEISNEVAAVIRKLQ